MSNTEQWQQDLIRTYQQELEQNRQKKVKTIKIKTESPTAQEISIPDLDDSLQGVRSSINKAIAQLEETFKQQYQQLNEVQRIVEQERQILSDAYQINVPPDSLAAMVQLRRERQFQAEETLQKERQDFQEMMDRKNLEFRLREEAFEERARLWEDNFSKKCQEEESALAIRLDSCIQSEESIKRRKQEQENLWIARSEELDAAYQSRLDELEAYYQQRIESEMTIYNEQKRELEQEISQYQAALQIFQNKSQLRESDPYADPSYRREPRATSPQPIPPGARIVRPLKSTRKDVS
jgi:hypothetical protein